MPALADFCAIDLLGDDGTVHRVAEAGASPTSAESVELPLAGRHQVLGTLVLASASAPLGDDGDLSLAEELARRIATGVENARLFGRQRSVAATLQHALLPERLPQFPGVASAALRYVNAGHPPPLLLSADRTTATFLDSTGGIPVGALATARYAEGRATVPAGATLLLYTDGLVEERQSSLDVGLARLREAILCGPADLDDLCSHVIARALDAAHANDDVALLAVRVDPLTNHLSLSLPSTVAVLPALRATLRRWLAQSGATEQESFELLVALGEACTNAIRHGSARPGSTFELEATAGGEIVARVSDHGRWREAGARAGGRGLAIIDNFELDISRTTDGTDVRMRRRLGAGPLPTASDSARGRRRAAR